MLSARAYSFRQKSRLAISLSWVGGYTNVVLFMICGQFVSNMTGNVTSLGKSLPEGLRGDIVTFGLLWVSFLAGAACSGLMTEVGRRRGSSSKYVLPLAVEMLLLTLVAIGIRAGYPFSKSSLVRAWLGCTAALAMGLQNATITRVSDAVVRTTHLTGVTTDLGLESVQCLFWLRARLANEGLQRLGRILRRSYRQAELQRVALLAMIIGSFLFGVIAGMIAFLHVPTLAMTFPVLFLLVVISMHWRTPTADLREIDVITDQELKLHGIVRSLLPAEIGIWRVLPPNSQKWHKAPDFEQWVEIISRRWRIIILTLSPLTRLTANDTLNLLVTAKKLRVEGRWLILAGMTPRQYKIIEEYDSAGVIAHAAVCPDLEFAVARGIELARGM